jgi:small GTP-binding protein
MFKCCAGRPDKAKVERGRTRTTDPDAKLTLKVVVVGDGAVGKTCLLVTFRDDKFPEDYVPTTFDNYAAHMRCMIEGNSKYVTYDLWDTAGQESYDEMRKMSYTDTDVFLVVFSLDRRASFDNVRNTWYPELAGYKPAGVASRRAKVVLVGTKSDMPNRAVSDQEAQGLARELGMYAYIGCSAKTRANVPAVFDMVVKAHLGMHPDIDIATARRSMGAGSVAGGQPAPVPAPAPAPQPSWHQPAPVPAPQPSWHQPAPAPAPGWHQPAPSWHQPAPAPYGQTAAQYQTYQAPTEAPQYGVSAGSLLPGLPPKWEKHFDQTGKPYYTDHNTQTTSWKPPPGCASTHDCLRFKSLCLHSLKHARARCVFLSAAMRGTLTLVLSCCP